MSLVLSPDSAYHASMRDGGGRARRGGRRTPVGGRPRWQPPLEQRAAVTEAARRGLSQDLIAALLGVSESTLKRRCARELTDGALLANARVALAAFELAVSGEHEAMTRFWLRTRMGWK